MRYHGKRVLHIYGRRQRREPQDFHPLAGMLPADVRKDGLEVQVYAWNGQRCVWAGVHYVREISPRVAYRLEKHWRRWREWYDNLPANAARHYPAKEGPRAADLLQIFPVGSSRPREESRLFRLPA